MEQNERMRLKKQYELYADDQILAMLADGPEAFVEGAYALLEQEADSRGIKKEAVRQQADNPAQDVSHHEDQRPQTFIEVIIINSAADRDLVGAALEPADIPYNFLNISVSAKELPVALMIEDRRIEEAISILRQLSLPSSIVLW
ncbi:MAG: hypothetical protein MUC52_01840 [Candidatus Omnitrophica bacterium]|jgi:hypothetical protein|nr:hypothetical protein [Candidatus Omnitrophota bacterium]